MKAEQVVQPPFWPKRNRFVDGLAGGGHPPVMMWITLQSPNVVEMVGQHGVDAVVIDLEHTTSGLQDVQTMLVAAQLAGMTALVRPPSIDQHVVGRLLDAGADGIVFPMVSSPAHAEAAARSVKYPPLGVRGWAGTHARYVRWTGALLAGGVEGFDLLSPAFTAAADAGVAVIFLIEHPAAVEHLEDILDVGAPHGVIFGSVDYLAHAGFDRNEVRCARQRVYDVCRARNVGFGLSLAPSDELGYYRGCFFSAGVDATIASDAVGARMREARTTIEAAMTAARISESI